MAPAGINAKRDSKPATPKRSPVIKIVQVHAPKLVCTDVANFRALVQEMTGNLSSIHQEKSHCTITKSDRPSKSTSCTQSEVSHSCTKQANHEARAAPQGFGQPRRAKICNMKARTIFMQHPATSSSSASVKAAKPDQHNDRGNGDEAFEDDAICESPVTSWDSTCESVCRVRPSHEYGHCSSRRSIDGFFADLHDNDDDDDGYEEDRQGAADTCGYSLNCSAYLPALAWRPAAPHDIPGGFDYFSF